MNMDPNDPKLTAYALGELGEQDKISLEKELTSNEQALRELEDTQMMAGLLSEALAAEPQPQLDEHRRKNIWARMRKGHWRGDRVFLRMWVMICMVLGVIAITWACMYMVSMGYLTNPEPEPGVAPTSLPAVITTDQSQTPQQNQAGPASTPSK